MTLLVTIPWEYGIVFESWLTIAPGSTGGQPVTQYYSHCISVLWWLICLAMHLKTFIDHHQILGRRDNFSRPYGSSKQSPSLFIFLNILISSAYSKIICERGIERSFTRRSITGNYNVFWSTPLSTMSYIYNLEFTRTLQGLLAQGSFFRIIYFPSRYHLA